MKYIVESEKTLEQAMTSLQEAIKNQGFGILHTYDLKETLKSKGIDLPHACQILEICNPQQAAAVLAEDMDLNMALPCRISVWENEGGKVKIGMIPPQTILTMLSDSPVLKTVSAEVEQQMKTMIQSAQ